MRTSIFLSLSVLLVVACGDDKNTSETSGTGSTSDTATGTTGTTGTGSTDTSSGSETGAPTSTGTETEPGTTGDPITSSTTQTSQVTGESSSGGETTGEPGSTGGDSSTGDESGSSSGGDPDGNASVENDCAPNDGPALQFKIDVAGPECGAPLSGDKLRVWLWQGGPLAPGEYELTQQMGLATIQIGNAEPITSTSGTLTIESWVGDDVVGSYDLSFMDDSTRQGDFAGPFCQVMIGCG